MKPLKINVITLFPEYFTSALKTSLLGKAIDRNLLEIRMIQLRDFAVNSYGQVDDAPYGGGSGMVLMIQPLKKALDSISEKTLKILLTPRGYEWTQKKCAGIYDRVRHSQNVEYDGITLICGHYEGFDERIVHYVDESICIGDYILSGGETAALVVIDSISRLIPGYMGNPDSVKEESFSDDDYVEYPQYTRPADFEGMKVPEVLLGGHHAKILEWRKEQSRRDFNKFRRDDEKPD